MYLLQWTNYCLRCFNTFLDNDKILIAFLTIYRIFILILSLFVHSSLLAFSVFCLLSTTKFLLLPVSLFPLPSVFSLFFSHSFSLYFLISLLFASSPPAPNSYPSLSHLISPLLLSSDKQLQFSPTGYITRVMSAALHCRPLD